MFDGKRDGGVSSEVLEPDSAHTKSSADGDLVKGHFGKIHEGRMSSRDGPGARCVCPLNVRHGRASACSLGLWAGSQP